MDNELEEGLGDTFGRVKDWIKSYSGTGAKPTTTPSPTTTSGSSTPVTPTVAGASTVDPNTPVPMFTGKDSLYEKLFNSLKSRLANLKDAKGVALLDKQEQDDVMLSFKDAILNVLKDISAQMKVNGLTQKQIQEALNQPPPVKTRAGGNVQKQAGVIDVRRAVFGKFEIALQSLGKTGRKGGKFRSAVDLNTRKQMIMDVVEKVIIPFLTLHLTSRGIQVVDRKANRTYPAKNVKDGTTAKTVTLSESTVNRWKEIAGIIKD